MKTITILCALLLCGCQPQKPDPTAARLAACERRIEALEAAALSNIEYDIENTRLTGAALRATKTNTEALNDVFERLTLIWEYLPAEKRVDTGRGKK
jgi:hypothetical protein